VVLTRGACFRCRLPSFSRALLIPKGRQSLFHLAVSRNGRVLFLSEWPLAALVEEPVYVLVRPWQDRNDSTIVQVRLRPLWQRPVLAAEASLAPEPTPSSHFRSRHVAFSRFSGLRARPERFVRHAPRPPALPRGAWINKPKSEEPAH